MIDILLVAIVAVIAWCVVGEGALGGALLLVSVIFSGLLAMNFFEPVAILLESTFNLEGRWSYFSDIVALLGLFGILLTVFRLLTDKIVPDEIILPTTVELPLRWGSAVLTGYVTMAIVLTALHTAPLPREFLGFTPERRNFLGMRAPDREWLGFTQYVSENALRRGNTTRIFDGPQLPLPNPAVEYWPSFPIRYATRREQLSAGGATSTATPAVRVRTVSPPGGGGGGGSNAPQF